MEYKEKEECKMKEEDLEIASVHSQRVGQGREHIHEDPYFILFYLFIYFKNKCCFFFFCFFFFFFFFFF